MATQFFNVTDALVEAFEAAVLEFIPENGGGVGIRFRNRADGSRGEH